MDAEQEVDLVIAGAGPAGMAAALIGAIEGLDVVLCEKSDQVGGTGATSAGTLWIPGNHQSKAAGFADSAEAAEKYLDGAHRRDGRRRVARGLSAHAGLRRSITSRPTATCNFCPAASTPTTAATCRGQRSPAAPSCPSHSTDACSAKTSPACARRSRSFMLFGGMMVGKADLAPLIGRFRSLRQFHLLGEIVRPLSRRPAALSARHAHHDGQRARCPALSEPAPAQRADPVRRRHRRPRR